MQILEGTKPTIESTPFSDLEYQRRLDGVRVGMDERGIDVFISFTPENIYYLTGHDTPGYYFYQACVVTKKQKPINILRNLELTNTLDRSWSRLAVGYEDREDPVEATLNLLRELGIQGKALGVEAEAWFVSPKRYLQLQRGIERQGSRVMDASGLVEGMRVVKSSEELACIRAAAKISEKGMRAAIEASSEGTDENAVASATMNALILAGSQYAGLPPFISSGPRSSITHATWAGRRYQKQDVLLYELAGVVKRYCGALFRTGTVGKPDAEFSRRAAVVRESLESIIAAIKPGALPSDLYAIHWGVFKKYDYSSLLTAGHRCAYSVGINYPPDWGEGHIISIWEGDRHPLRPGMTFHLVPGFIEAGRYSLFLSETFLVTETGCEVLTDFPRETFVV